MQFAHFVTRVSEGRSILERGEGDFVDARIESVRTLRFEADLGGSKNWREQNRLGAGTRVLRGDTWGFAAMEGPPDWKAMRTRAVCLARAAGAGTTKNVTLAPVEPLSLLEQGTDELRFPSPEEVLGLIEEARDVLPSVRSLLVRGQFHDGWRGVISSEGALAVKPVRAGLIALSAVVPTFGGGVTTLPLYAGGARGCHVEAIRSQFVAARELAEQLASARRLSPSRGQVVLSPQIAALLIHEALGHLCEADRLPRNGGGRDLRGMAVGITSLNVVDCAERRGASGSELFDDEAVLCRPAPLIVAGRWEGLLHTRATASAFGVIPTGNARITAWSFQPLCRMRVTELACGPTDPGDLLGEVRDGIYLDHPHGGHVRGSRFRIQAATAWRIRSGRLVEPLTNAVLVGSPLEVLAKIGAIGSDQKLTDGVGWCSRGEQVDLPVSMAAPTVWLREAELDAGE